jgi:membrane-associated phospholipid phosphatase
MFIFFFLISLAFAYDDPTGGKPFGPWLWDDQVKPMVKEAAAGDNLLFLGGMVAGTYVTMPYDHKVRAFANKGGHLLVGEEEAKKISDFTDTWLELGTSVVLLGVDTKEGVKLSRALIFSLASYSFLKRVTSRERPDGSDHASWPSGHSSAMFTLAGSLSYSYGWKAAIPAYTAAALTGLSRIKENKHWASDVVAGAFLGTYWATVSAKVSDKRISMFLPVPVNDGMAIVWMRQL